MSENRKRIFPRLALTFAAACGLTSCSAEAESAFDFAAYMTIFTAVLLPTLITITILLANIVQKRKIIERQDASLRSALEQVTDANENMALTFDTMSVGIRIVRLDDGQLVYANKASMYIFGCEDFERDVAGKSAFDFMPEIQPNGRTTADMANEFLAAGSGAMEFACFRLDGEPFTARITSCNINYKGKLSSLAIIEDITEKKRMEDALQESLYESNRIRDIMTSILNRSDVMIYVTDTETDEILFINDIMKRHFKFDDSVIGKPCYAIFQENQSGRCDFCPCHRLDIEPDAVVVWEDHNSVTNRHYRKSDQYADWPGGKKVHIQHCVDITDIKKTQEELEVQKNTLQTMINSMPDFVFGKNLNFEYTLLNQAAATFLNVDKDGVIGKNDIDGLGFPPEVAEALMAQDKKIFDGAPKFVEEHWIPSHNGVARYYETMKAPITQDGVIVGLVGTSRDITEKKQMEDTLREANFKARNARAHEFISRFSVPFTQPYDFDELINNALFELRDFTETDKAFIVELQPDGSLLCTYEDMINEDITSRLGQSLAGDDITPLFKEADRTGCFYEKNAARYFEKYPHIYLGEKSFCCIPLMVDGECIGYIVFLAMYEQANWTEGEFRLVTMASSIVAGAFSNRKKNMLKEEALKAQQASEAKSNFLSVMSHEMRTPLNAIIGMTAIAKDARDATRKDYALKKIEDASTSLLGIVNDVLDMAKIEANKLELSPIAYSVERMLHKVLSIVKFRMDEKQQKFDMLMNDGVPCFVVGDDQRLSQVLTNLLTNASKFTPEGGEISLSVSLQSEENGICQLRFEVTDNGIGISATQQGKLFQAFLQAESGTSRAFGGTGLGLALCKRIVELMDGQIWVESELGKGSRFIFTVNVERGEQTNECLESKVDRRESSCAKATRNQFNGKRLLLAEDVEVNREIVLSLLDDTGLVIDEAENGRAALEKVKADPGRYDLVFMDVQMPKMDGLEATRSIRALPDARAKTLPIVALTANVFKEDVEKCLAAGMDGHLGKPLDMDEVMAVLNRYLTD